jgi:hypothetical protein
LRILEDLASTPDTAPHAAEALDAVGIIEEHRRVASRAPGHRALLPGSLIAI